MRYIDLHVLHTQIFATEPGKKVIARLRKANQKHAGMRKAVRMAYANRNGPNKWKPVKDLATGILGQKCWYTEVELLGAHLVVDHYRPVCVYWWLTYDPENYRIACPWANSYEANTLHRGAGGKGKNFPLLFPAVRAKNKYQLRNEKPVILDPCDEKDCELLAFQADGRPILNPVFAGNAIAMLRVNESKILLNLDHPDFNTKREQLCHAIADDVRTHEALPANSPIRVTIRTRLAARLSPKAPFSTAARFYLQLHRHLDWVENILNLP